MTTHPLIDALMTANETIAEQKRKSEAAVAMRSDPDRAIPILRDCLAAWDKPNPFKRGDIIKVASHSSIWNTEATGLAIVIRTHDLEEVQDDNQQKLMHSYDMRILLVYENGGCLEFRAHSRDFELVLAASETKAGKKRRGK